MMGMRRYQISRWVTMGLILILLYSFSCKTALADTGEEFNRRINPGETYFIEFSLSISDAIYVRFHVTYGVGIYFFIVDQDGYDDIMAGRAAETVYKEKTYYAEEGQWRYIDFSPPHVDTWYVWFSKAPGAPLADSAATIEGHAREDTDGPIIQIFSVAENPISGSVEVQYKVLDLGYPVAKLSLLANGTEVSSITNPDQNHYTYGFEASGKLIWDSTTVDNANYSLILVAYDSLGHSNFSTSINVVVSNGFWDYSRNWLIVGIIAAIVILALIYIFLKD